MNVIISALIGSILGSLAGVCLTAFFTSRQKNLETFRTEVARIRPRVFLFKKAIRKNSQSDLREKEIENLRDLLTHIDKLQFYFKYKTKKQPKIIEDLDEFRKQITSDNINYDVLEQLSQNIFETSIKEFKNIHWFHFWKPPF